MPDHELEDTLDLAIDVCADFEKKTHVKTHEIMGKPQKEVAAATGLSIKEIKKWTSANAVAQKTLTKIEASRK